MRRETRLCSLDGKPVDSQGCLSHGEGDMSANGKLRILIVDDVSSMRGLIRDGLSKMFADLSLDEAADGREALEKLQEASYDLVLCDWIMPEISGDQLLRCIRNSPRLKDLPFIMITTKGEKESVMEALQAGANDYVVKPFTAEGLAERIQKTLSR